MGIDDLIPEIRPDSKKTVKRYRPKRNLIIFLLAACLVALIVIFWPMKMSSRILPDKYLGVDIIGTVTYFADSNQNKDLEIFDNRGNQEFLDWLGGLWTVRSLRKYKMTDEYSDHQYRFLLTDRRSNKRLMLAFDGRYIEVLDGNRSRKYRVIPKDYGIKALDEMLDRYIDRGYSEPLKEIGFTDYSDKIEDKYEVMTGTVEIEWLDAHSGTYYEARFKGFRPYDKLEFYEDSEGRLVIFYDEGEGDPGMVYISLDHLPSHPDYSNSKIVFFLNGERSYRTEFTYAME